MKTSKNHRGKSPQMLSECGQGRPEPILAHSKGGPDVNPLKNRISVRFANPLPEQIEIKFRLPVPKKIGSNPFALEIMAWMGKTNALIL